MILAPSSADRSLISQVASATAFGTASRTRTHTVSFGPIIQRGLGGGPSCQLGISGAIASAPLIAGHLRRHGEEVGRRFLRCVLDVNDAASDYAAAHGCSFRSSSRTTALRMTLLTLRSSRRARSTSWRRCSGKT
jgi:hypothetical protein